ncbi:uncharacterized protein F5147DRAFT_661611 [Suillus discolor]|uniref:Uncharacterized protein n=1 Tax=Suillus discolor TaxID=1912936 RepID=A0A9P7EPS7_9AGAM|nr:uncharacterized protein F5147DRAFT_661611 [Suillus discolor]KAG2079872.1 hypothetical protein F5147DRAFT_661611 [Suillus discolor]
MSNIVLSASDAALNIDMKGRESLLDSLFTTASVLFGLVDPLDIKALIEVSLKEDATQTGLQQEEESCLEYLKRGGRFLMEERMDQAQLEVSLFSNAIANLCEELNGRCHPTPSSVNPEKLVTPNAVRHAVTPQYPCPHDHVQRPNDQLIPLPRVMKAWVNNFTYCAFTSASLAEANGPLRFDHGNSFTTKKLKSLEVLKSDFQVLDLKKQRAQSEVDMLSEAIARIAKFHSDNDDFYHIGFDDCMSTSSMSSGSSP